MAAEDAPSKEERRAAQQRFAQLDGPDRRHVVRSVNRGRAVEERKLAPHAVHVARRQMRFWRWSWLVGPVVVLAQMPQLGWELTALNLLVAGGALGAMSYFFWARSRRAEEANLELVDRRRRRSSATGDGAPARSWWRRRRSGNAPTTAGAGHLPGETPPADADQDAIEPSDVDDAQQVPGIDPQRRPYQPRRRKRRDRR